MLYIGWMLWPLCYQYHGKVPFEKSVRSLNICQSNTSNSGISEVMNASNIVIAEQLAFPWLPWLSSNLTPLFSILAPILYFPNLID